MLGLPTLTLTDGSGVGEWCGAIAKDLSAYFAHEITAPYFKSAHPGGLTGHVDVTRYGRDVILNHFCDRSGFFAGSYSSTDWIAPGVG
jgi:hypothetical protein